MELALPPLDLHLKPPPQVRELIRSREDSLVGQLQSKEAELKEKEKLMAKKSSHLKTLQDNIKQEERKRKQIQKGLEVGGLATFVTCDLQGL